MDLLFSNGVRILLRPIRFVSLFLMHWERVILSYRPFGNINYGFALPRNSPYTHNFSVAMLELQQDGFLERMTEKWFRSRSACSAETQAAQATAEEGGDQLRFIDMAGVFITLAVGVVAGVVILFFELIYASFKDAKCKEATVSCRFERSRLYCILYVSIFFIIVCVIVNLEPDTDCEEMM